MESGLSHRDDYETAAAAAMKLPSCTTRNDETIINKIFNNQSISWSDSENIKVSYSWAKQYVSTKGGKTNNSQGKFPHPFLTNDYVLLNTYGSVLEEARFAAIRGIVRDRGEDWILGYNKYLGNCSIFYAKS
ncbi:hypothetical protein Gogos_010341 [Gossypium gossypioides]|uniref:Uncharacterized protein n=1 Tax=Gossypium gossypioides TaxID=34282 RepID=A0A7J9BL04_GOSGO|nr:hypothetical protein [Gossypium gossypioides]